MHCFGFDYVHEKRRLGVCAIMCEACADHEARRASRGLRLNEREWR